MICFKQIPTLTARRLPFRTAFGLSIALLLTACAGETEQSPEESAAEPSDEFTVGIAWSDLSATYFISLRDAVDDSAASFEGLNLVHVSAGNDASRQLDQIDELISQNVDLLAITAVEGDAAEPGVRRAVEAGIPVITLDTPIPTADEDGLLVTHVGASAELGGYLQARYICEEIAPDAKILGLWGPAGDETVRKRVEGVERAMKEEDCSELEIVDEDYALAHSPEEAADAMQDWLQVFAPGEVDAVASYGDHLSSAALQVLRAERRDDIILLGAANFGDFPLMICDGDPQAAATVDFNLTGQGEDFVQTVQTVREGQASELPDWVVTEAILVTEDNCADFPPG